MAAGVFTIGPCGCCGGGCCPGVVIPDTLTLTVSVDPSSDPACDFTCAAEAYPLVFTLTKVICAGGYLAWVFRDFDGGTGPGDAGPCGATWQFDPVGCTLIQGDLDPTDVCLNAGGGNVINLFPPVSCAPLHFAGSVATLSPHCQINVDITE